MLSSKNSEEPAASIPLIRACPKPWERRHPCRRDFPHVFGGSRRQDASAPRFWGKL